MEIPPPPRPKKKQQLQRLSILTAQVKTGSTSENLLKEIKEIVYSFYWVKQMSIKYTIAY